MESLQTPEELGQTASVREKAPANETLVAQGGEILSQRFITLIREWGLAKTANDELLVYERGQRCAQGELCSKQSFGSLRNWTRISRSYSTLKFSRSVEPVAFKKLGDCTFRLTMQFAGFLLHIFSAKEILWLCYKRRHREYIPHQSVGKQEKETSGLSRRGCCTVVPYILEI